MSERHSAFAPIFNMEIDVIAVRRWARILNHLGSGDSSIQPEEIYVISGVLSEIGRRLEANWKDAFAASRGEP